MRLKEHLLGQLVKSLPRRILSQYFGRLAFCKLPEPLRSLSLRAFVWWYQIDLTEAEFNLKHYASVGELFIRKLRAGVRPLAATDYVHPSDSTITEHGEIRQGQLLQVKDWPYSVEEFLGDAELAREFEGGYFITYYLCPTDYHRVHAPMSGQIVASCHVVGDLWPVNAWSVRSIKGLFAINERVITQMQTQQGKIAVVMVGATNVGQMRMMYDSQLVTNQQADNAISGMEYRHRAYIPGLPTQKGDELGVFYMGSTVIVLFTAQAKPAELAKLRTGPVQVGKSMGS